MRVVKRGKTVGRPSKVEILMTDLVNSISDTNEFRAVCRWLTFQHIAYGVEITNKLIRDECQAIFEPAPKEHQGDEV